MSDMERCKCCGITNSGARKSNKKLDDLLDSLQQDLVEAGHSRGLIEISKYRIGRIVTGVTSSERPMRLAYERHITELSNLHRMLGEALKLENAK